MGILQYVEENKPWLQRPQTTARCRGKDTDCNFAIDQLWVSEKIPPILGLHFGHVDTMLTHGHVILEMGSQRSQAVSQCRHQRLDIGG